MCSVPRASTPSPPRSCTVDLGEGLSACIVPGLSTRDSERLARRGARRGGEARRRRHRDGTVVTPGTHGKWARL